MSNVGGSLFPSAENKAHAEQITEVQNIDWLENKSYTTETAEKALLFQHDLEKLTSHKHKETKKRYSSDSDSNEDTQPTGHKKKYSSDSDSNACMPYTHASRGKEIKYWSDSDSKEFTKSTRHKKKRYSSDSDNKDTHTSTYKRNHSSDADSDTYRKKKKKKHKKKHKKEKRYMKVKEDIKIMGQFDSKHTFHEEVQDIAPNHAFKLDKNAEKNNWTYGSLYAGHVARYNPTCSQPLAEQGTNITIYDKNRKKEKRFSNRYFGKDNRKAVKELSEHVVCLTEQGNNGNQDLPIYIALADKNDEDISGKDIRQQIFDDFKCKNVERNSTIDVGETIEIIQDPVQLKVARYNKKLREFPNDVKLWLEFVNFQDTISKDEITVDEQNKKQSAQGVFDKKLSIIDKALELNPGNIDLLLAKINLNSSIRDSSEVKRELEKLLFVHSADTRLWRYYLTFNQSRLAVFTVSKMIKYYQKCFRTLFAISEGRTQTHTVPENLEKEILEIFVQYCTALKQSGFKEKAIASFQAQIEFNMFPLSSLTAASKETKMAAFEKFWDSNCPKAGTTGCCGWRNWQGQDQNKAQVKEPAEDPLEEMETKIIEENLSKHQSWLKIEELRDQNHWLPWQPGEGETEEDCEDVERLVVYSDVSPILFEFSKHLHYELVLSFLKLLGINSNCDNALQVQGCFSETVDEVTHIPQSDKLEALIGNQSEPTQTFAVELLKLVIPCFKDKNRSDLTVMLIETRLRKNRRVKEKMSKLEKKEMKAFMKQTLKEEQNRNDLAVWSAYIDLERWIGKPGEAEGVLETALFMYSGVNIETTNTKTVGLVTLFCQYCEMLLKMDNCLPCKMYSRTAEVPVDIKKRVLSVINCMMEANKFNAKELINLSGVAILKTFTNLSNLCNNLCFLVCDSKQVEVSVLQEYCIKLTWCCGLFAYCKSDLASAIEVYTVMIERLGSFDNRLLEVKKRLRLDMMKLIVFHMSVASSPLHTLREHLETVLHEFPTEELFLSLFIDIERKARITGRLNNKFDRWSRSSDNPTPTVFAILYQLEYLASLKTSDEDTDVSFSSVVHRSRVWLENSLSHNSLQHCPILWRLYLQVEKQAGNIERMKSVFYRAVQHCPWNKSIYMDGICLLGGEHLNELVDLMIEKELRVHIPVEELDILVSP